MKKVGIVGIGGVASYAQIPAYIEKGIRIQAICDINEEILNKIGDKYNISNRYTDIEEMIVKEKVDIIDVATPPQTHLDIIRIANKYNVEVIMQKPLIVDIKEFEQLKELINANKHLKLNLTGRYVSAWQKIKKILNNKEIGKPLICTITNNDWWDREPGRWDLKTKDYIIFEMLIHHLDLCNFWFGYPKRITARGGHSEKQLMKNMNFVNVTLEYEDGFIVQIIENWLMPEFDFATGHPFEDVLITGEEGAIKANSEIVKLSTIGDNDIRTWKLPRPGQKLPVESLENNWFIDSFGCAMADYLDYFNKNEKELEDKEYAIELTKLTFKVSEATKSNKWIEI